MCVGVCLLILGTAGCAGRRAATREVLVDDERVYRLAVADGALVCVGADGDTLAADAAAGRYVLSGGRMARIAERLRRCPE